MLMISFLVYGVCFFLGGLLFDVPVTTTSLFEDSLLNTIVTTVLIGGIGWILLLVEFVVYLVLAAIFGIVFGSKKVFVTVFIILCVLNLFIQPGVLLMVQPEFTWMPSFNYWQLFVVSLLGNIVAFTNGNSTIRIRVST